MKLFLCATLMGFKLSHQFEATVLSAQIAFYANFTTICVTLMFSMLCVFEFNTTIGSREIQNCIYKKPKRKKKMTTQCLKTNNNETKLNKIKLRAFLGQGAHTKGKYWQ